MPLPTARPRLYWTLQLVGWGLYGGLGLAMIHLFATKIALTGPLVAIQAAVVGVLLLASHGLRAWWRWRRWQQASIGGLLGQLVLANGAAAVAAQLVLRALIAWGIRPPASLGVAAEGGQFVGYVLQTYFVLWLWTALYFGWHYFESYRQADIDKWKLVATVREAEMRTLKAQINPHFLFNGLNNIRALVVEDPARARLMMTHLADLLRYAIQLNSTEQVPLARELEIVRYYLELEAVQLEERLAYTLDADALALDALVPPMTLQLLVENAVKHGIAPRAAGGCLSLVARADAATGALHVAVRNTGRFRPAPGAEGIGLRNVRERLHLLFGDRAALAVADDADAPGTVAAHLRLPLVRRPVPARPC